MRTLLAVVLTVAGCGADPTDTPAPDLRMPMVPGPCTNGFTDGDETDQDCGGPVCAPCDTGKACAGARDCLSGICANRTCAAPSCADTVKNGSESDVDCGAQCPMQCAEGRMCGDGPDCQSANCVNGVCGKSPCANGLLDGMETDVDCGGPVCPDKCADGKICGDGSDCESTMCVNQVCKSNCPAGMGDCDGNAGNGCEASLMSDPKNCGQCGRVCPQNTPTCIGGKCSIRDLNGVFSTYNFAGRDVYIWKTPGQCVKLSGYRDFCTKRGLAWWRPKSQADAQKLIDAAWALQNGPIWIQVFGVKTEKGASTVGGFMVQVGGGGCLESSDGTDFGGFRAHACSFCNPNSNLIEKMNNGESCCWDKSNAFDWFVCEG